MVTTCKNCTQQFEGDFCNNCGQKSKIKPINFSYVLEEIRTGVFQFDKGLFFTIKELFIRPGHTIREYLQGKRVNHFKPIAFLLLLATLYAVTQYFLDIKQDSSESLDTFTKYNSQDQTFAGINLKGKLNGFIKYNQWLKDNYAYNKLLLIPVFSLASYISFLRIKYNYFEHLILGTLVGGQIILINLLFLPLQYFLGGDVNMILFLIQSVIGFLFTIWAYFQFFNDKKLSFVIGLLFLTYFLYLIFTFVQFFTIAAFFVILA